MPRWSPGRIWEGEDVYVVGGGDSLRGFDWGTIEDYHAIGCNSNYILGAHICDIIVFGDFMWWERIGRKGTESYGGLVVGCSNRLKNSDCPWLLTMPRHQVTGLGTDALGWHGNTGSLAINLALILGAKRVFLLGFDMKLGPKTGQANWHDLRYEGPKADVYPKFCKQMEPIARTLPVVFPGCKIINVTDDSALDLFPKVSLEKHFKTREGCHVTS